MAPRSTPEPTPCGPIYPLATTSGSLVRGPALFIAGQNDTIVVPIVVRTPYNLAIQVPAIFAGQRGLYFGPNCTYCTSTFWSVFERNAKAQAVPGP